MKRVLLWGFGLVVLVVLALGGYLWWRVGKIDVEKVGNRVYMMTGVGGNVGLLVTDGGVVVVDTMTFVRQGEKIEAQIAKLTDQPVVAVINSHYHLDHTHGNPAFPVGTKVVATERTLDHLLRRDAEFWAESPATDLLPNDTFDHEYLLEVGGETVRLLHPGRGHTDGDLVVVFGNEKIVHLGDLLFHGYYPNIDLEAGGSVGAWITTIDRILEIDFDGIIPGHGPFTDRDGLVRFQEFLRSLREQTAEIAREGGSFDDALERVDLTPFALESPPYAPFLDREFVIGRAWEEATGEKPE